MVLTGENRKQRYSKNIPNDDNNEIQQVPSAAYVGTGVHDQAVGQNFCKSFNGEDDKKDILHLFLKSQRLLIRFVKQ